MATSVTAAGWTRSKLLQASAAATTVARLTTAEKDGMLLAMADALESNTTEILRANEGDLKAQKLSGALRDRLLLNSTRVVEMARGVRVVAGLADPVHETVAEWTRPNGLRIRKVRVPLGVVGVIYESRPNVTVDAVALVLKAGNAVVLRGGREAAYSNQQLVEILSSIPGMPAGAVALLDSSTHDSVRQLIAARGLVDVLIPRGGQALIDYVTQHAAIPVIETGAGNCHIFVDASADLDMADNVVLNAKTQRPSVCNAMEKLLVHENIAAEYIPRIVRKLHEAGVEVRGDSRTCELARGMTVTPAQPADWDEEYLRLSIAIRVVPDLREAMAHIQRHSTRHSEAIITGDTENAQDFLRFVDSAAVYWNASTRFTDGGEFGFGAEMGISTQKLHCRGPFGLTELTSTKYEVIGCGQVRR